MPAFLYYLPGSAGYPLGAAPPRELAYALGSNLSRRDVHGGPDGGDGVLLADAARLGGDELGYYPERQKWRRLEATGLRPEERASSLAPQASGLSPQASSLKPQAYVGLYSDRPAPGPGELLRADALRGVEVELLDGRRWLVPIARGFAEEDGELRWYRNLPRGVELDDQGRWVHGTVLSRYAPLWDLACRWEESRLASPGRESGDVMPVTLRFDFSDLIDAAVTALAANYAVGRVEVALAGLLTEELCVEVLDVLIDLPTRLDWIKKKLAVAQASLPVDPASESSSAGPAGSIAATGQP